MTINKVFFSHRVWWSDKLCQKKMDLELIVGRSEEKSYECVTESNIATWSQEEIKIDDEQANESIESEWERLVEV